MEIIYNITINNLSIITYLYIIEQWASYQIFITV